MLRAKKRDVIFFVIIGGKRVRKNDTICVEGTVNKFFKVLAIDVSHEGRERPVMIGEATRFYNKGTVLLQGGYILTNWPHVSRIKVYAK